MTHRCGGILRSMSDTERRQQMDRIRDAMLLTERQAAREELTKAAALLAIEPCALQPELELEG